MNLVALEHPWSTMVRIVLYPLDLGRSVMKSIKTYWKGPSSVGVSKWCKGAWGSQMVLLSWHLVHPLTYCSTYSLSLGPWYFHLTKSRVLDIPGWPPVGASWRFLRIVVASEDYLGDRWFREINCWVKQWFEYYLPPFQGPFFMIEGQQWYFASLGDGE